MVIDPYVLDFDDLGIAVGSPELQRCSLTIEYFDGSTIVVGFVTLAGNRAASYDNWVTVWEDSIVPWKGGQPVASMKVPVDASSGSVAFTGVSVGHNAYTVGYAVGPRLDDCCACVTLGAGEQAGPGCSVGLAVGFVGSTDLLLHYTTLPGYGPASAGNWVGVWPGRVDPFAAPEPLCKQALTAETSAGDVGFNDLALASDTTYSAIYFMNESTTSAAAQLTFSTAAALNVTHTNSPGKEHTWQQIQSI